MNTWVVEQQKWVDGVWEDDKTLEFDSKEDAQAYGQVVNACNQTGNLQARVKVYLKGAITVYNDTHFLEVLRSLDKDRKKLILAAPKFNTNLLLPPVAEIRFMATAGGGQFGYAEIRSSNQRHSGMYSRRPDDAYLFALDMEHSVRTGPYTWRLVDDCEHTVNTYYNR